LIFLSPEHVSFSMPHLSFCFVRWVFVLCSFNGYNDITMMMNEMMIILVVNFSLFFDLFIFLFFYFLWESWGCAEIWTWGNWTKFHSFYFFFFPLMNPSCFMSTFLKLQVAKTVIQAANRIFKSLHLQDNNKQSSLLFVCTSWGIFVGVNLILFLLWSRLVKIPNLYLL
jgi:hypothetical protein